MRSRSRTIQKSMIDSKLLEEEIHLILFQFVWQLTTMHSVSNN